MDKKKILIVDDEKLMRDLLSNLLGSEYDCVTAENGVAGLSYLEKHPGEMDLIITDLMMPGMDGFAMLDCVRSNDVNKSTPTLVVTSMEDKNDIRRAFDLGVDDVVIKPVDVDILKQRVKNMLTIGRHKGFHNVMEDVILTEINENIDNLGICTCPQCRRDLLALALNNVDPKYVNTEKGAVITKVGSMSRESRAKLLAVITRCAEVVRERPRHE